MLIDLTMMIDGWRDRKLCGQEMEEYMYEEGIKKLKKNILLAMGLLKNKNFAMKISFRWRDGMR